jgi:hypothetical protein
LFVESQRRFPILPIQHGQNPFVLAVVAFAIAIARIRLDIDFLFAAVENDMLLFRGKLLPGV